MTKTKPKAKAKGAKASWNEFYNSLPEEYIDWVMGDAGAYSSMEELFHDAFNQFHPKGNKNRISGDYDLGETPEKTADIFFFQDPDYGDPDDAEDPTNVMYKKYPEMRENFLRLIAGSPEEKAAAMDIATMSPSDVAKHLRTKYPVTRGWNNDSLGNEIKLYRSLYDRVPEDFQDYNSEEVVGLESIYEPIIFDNISNDDFLKSVLPWLYDTSDTELENIPPEAIADLKRAIHSDKGLPEPDFFETYFKNRYNNGDDDWEERYNNNNAVKAINEYKHKKSEPKEEKSDKDTVPDVTQKNIIAGLKSFNI